ncbi:hypothetical protein AB0F71_39885, partial [Kitasatospora sp. NPDC028055]|uniref:hypothetical protein n=1 Tax=Kitasatospora sp. NPDC028055 TaxID=3155653 RepID=UPI0033CB61FD
APASIGTVFVPATEKAAGVAGARVTDEPPPAAVGAAGAAEGWPWAVGTAVGVGVGVELLVAAVAAPPAVAMTAAVAAMSVIGRIRMNPCPFLRASG